MPWFFHLAGFLAWIPVFLGHFFLAVVNPGTRPALRGMLLGTVDRAWAEHHHAAWVAGLAPERTPRAEAIPGSAPAHTPLAALEAVAADGGSVSVSGWRRGSGSPCSEARP